MESENETSEAHLKRLAAENCKMLLLSGTLIVDNKESLKQFAVDELGAPDAESATNAIDLAVVLLGALAGMIAKSQNINISLIRKDLH